MAELHKQHKRELNVYKVLTLIDTNRPKAKKRREKKTIDSPSGMYAMLWMKRRLNQIINEHITSVMPKWWISNQIVITKTRLVTLRIKCTNTLIDRFSIVVNMFTCILTVPNQLSVPNVTIQWKCVAVGVRMFVAVLTKIEINN